MEQQHLTVNITGNINSVGMVDDSAGVSTPEGSPGQEAASREAQNENVNRLCTALSQSAENLQNFQEELFSSHRDQIIRLSIEIAKKILIKDTQERNYDIEKILGDALKTVPSQQDVVVRLNPTDLQEYQQITSDSDGNAIANIQFTADPGIGLAECVVETNKGMVEYLIEEHLDQISKALKLDQQE
jgi:flagellar assembly protein FliH